MQDSAAQQWWYSSYNTGSEQNLYILVNLSKWLQVEVAYDEDTGNQNGKSFTLFFPLSSSYYHYYHYFHSLLTAPTNAPSPKHYPSWGSNADQNDGKWQSYCYTNQLTALDQCW